jgi:hypothetical protein
MSLFVPPNFGLCWLWINRPSYQIEIRHQFEIAGFKVENQPSIGLDPMGLEWMRTSAPLREAVRAIDRSLLGIGLCAVRCRLTEKNES